MITSTPWNRLRASVPIPYERLIVLAVVAAAVMVGMYIGEGKWLYVAALAAALAVVLFPVQAGLGAFAFLIPFDSISALSQGERSRSLTWFVAASAAMVLLAAGLVGKRLRRPPRAALWWGLFVFWAIVTTLWALDQSVALRQLPSLLTLFAFYLISVSIDITALELKWVLLFAVLGACAASLFMMREFYSGISWASSTIMRGSLVYEGRETNPNAFATDLLLPFTVAIAYSVMAATWTRRVAGLGAVAIIGYAVYLTMSRGVLLATVVVLLIFCYHLRRNWRRLLPVLGTFLIPLLMVPSLFFSRLEQAGATGGSGRMDIWAVGLVLLKKYGVLGAGIYNFPVAYASSSGYAPHFMGYARDAHNIYLAITVEFGIAGLLLFAAAVLSQLRAAQRQTNSSHSVLLVACGAACCGLLVQGMFANILWYKAFWFSWILLTLVMNRNVEAREPASALPSGRANWL